MEKFEGNGAECMVKFIADGGKGHISVNDGRMLFGEVAWKARANRIAWCIDWLAEPCTYTPPEPQWIECTAGEALDAWMNGKKVQSKLWDRCNDTNIEWVDLPPYNPQIVIKAWLYSREYRKEA